MGEYKKERTKQKKVTRDKTERRKKKKKKTKESVGKYLRPLKTQRGVNFERKKKKDGCYLPV